MENFTPDEALALVQYLREFMRDRAYWNPSDVARATGIPNATVRDWLNGRKPRGLANLQALRGCYAVLEICK